MQKRINDCSIPDWPEERPHWLWRIGALIGGAALLSALLILLTLP